MPQSPARKAEYQRQRRETVKPRRTSTAKAAALAEVPPGHEHYWLRRAGDDFAVCTLFEMQGRMTGGCGQRRQYKGKLLPAFDDHPDLAAAIIDSDQFKKIQGAMPLTKTRG